MRPPRLTRRGLLAGALVPSALSTLNAAAAPDFRKLDRSYWPHASLGTVTQYGYWGREFPRTAPPTREEVRRAARLLTDHYGANRLYLMYHQEISPAAAAEVFRWWREACPEGVELVPTLVLRMYNKPQAPVFSPAELRDLCTMLKAINARRVGVCDIYPNRDQGPGLKLLEEMFPGGIIRVGLQPGEQLSAPYVAAVEDTWSGFCHGKTNADWVEPGFGRDTLRKWLQQ